MFNLYSMIIGLLFLALGFVAISFRIEQEFSFKNFFLLSLFVIIFSLGLYRFTSQYAALKAWLAEGKQHYELQEKVAQMGGVSGIMVKIKKRLEQNPNDKEGWQILGKLYLASGDEENAKKAFQRAAAIKK